MRIAVSEAARKLELSGALKRASYDHSDLIIRRVRDLLNIDLPVDLEDFYRERIAQVGDFRVVTPAWSDRVGWLEPEVGSTALLHAGAVPIFLDGCGGLFGLDLTSGDETPAVYFFDQEGPRPYARPDYAAGSSLGAFLLLVADHDRSLQEQWPAGWQLAIDPDIDKCPRAPPIWLVD